MPSTNHPISPPISRRFVVFSLHVVSNHFSFPEGLFVSPLCVLVVFGNLSAITLISPRELSVGPDVKLLAPYRISAGEPRYGTPASCTNKLGNGKII